MSLNLGKIRSGAPANPGGRSFQPPMCLLASPPIITRSVEAFLVDRTRRIISERSSRLKVSIRVYCLSSLGERYSIGASESSLMSSAKAFRSFFDRTCVK